MKKINLVAVLLIALSGFLFGQTSWKLDKSHTNVGFEVDHMLIASVDGEFSSYDGTITTNGDSFADASITLSIDVSSINTNNDDRDNHLKSDDFFNAEKFPKITFQSKSMEKVDDKNWKLVGDFTIRDVTKEITLDVKFRGMVKDPWGNTRVGFELEGTINRFDYNLKWNKLLETGGLVVGEEVELVIDVELIKES